ncbi:c-type cytochrome [Sporocytophaga myxococcoides]|uniref:c-type cytochrome n=1 Tax=Sporocytophaga myxococcoides TaxID=153721 RepID=UPI0003F63857|nr:cytochrome c [Sporocytophaga myxococcoides]
MKKLALLFLLSISFYSCKDEKKDNPTPDNICITSDVTYTNTVKPIITKNCVACHGAATPMNLNDVSTLQGIAQNGKLYKVITHADGVSPMPKNQAKLSDCDIEKIKVWIDAGAQNN